MIIKSVKMSGFKNVTDSEPKRHEFFYNTIIKGENFVGKTSVGDALCWVFGGRSSAGISAEYVLKNDASSSMAVEAVFEDNGGREHGIRRESTGQNRRIYLDGIPVSESELSSYVGSPEIFLATFMVGYFHRLSPKAAKELLTGVIPFPANDRIAGRVSKDVRDYLPSEEQFDSNQFLKQKRSDLKMIEDEIKRCQARLSMAAEKLKSVKTEEPIDESELKNRTDALEARKENLIKALAQNNTAGFLEGKLSVVRLEILSLTEWKEVPPTLAERTCPTCKQPIPSEDLLKLEQKLEEENALKRQRLEKLKEDEKLLLQSIREEREKSDESRALQDELKSVDDELKGLRDDYEKIILHNQTVKAEMNFAAESQKAYETSQAALEKLSQERYRLNRAITAVSEYNAIKADMQYEVLRSSFRNVTIRLQRLNQNTNELRDVFEILYKGRDYDQMSTSEAIRAGMEIANSINARTGLKLPMFIDNAESITHYTKPDTQVFEAKVEKDAPLTVAAMQ